MIPPQKNDNPKSYFAFIYSKHCFFWYNLMGLSNPVHLLKNTGSPPQEGNLGRICFK